MSWVDTLPQWIAAVGGTGGLGFGLKYITDRRRAARGSRRADVDATRVLTDTALTLIEPLERAIAELRHDLEMSRQESIALRDDVQALHEYITVLIDALTAASVPVPERPPLPIRPPDEAPDPHHRRRNRT